MAGKVLAVVNRKGGVGKTTTAITLAHGLARRLIGENGQTAGSVLLIDLDPQGNCATALGMQTNGVCISDLLLGNRRLDEVILTAGRDGLDRPNLYLIPSTDRLADAKLSLVANAAVGSVLRQMSRNIQVDGGPIDEVLQSRLGQAKEVFDFIILDCPPTLDMLEQAVYKFADGAIVPVKVDYLGAAGAAQHTRGIIQSQSEGIDIRVTMIVPTFVRHRQVLARQMLQTLRTTYGPRRVSTPVPATVKVEEAPAANGQTLFEYAPDSPATLAYQDLVEKIYHG